MRLNEGIGRSSSWVVLMKIVTQRGSSGHQQVSLFLGGGSNEKEVDIPALDEPNEKEVDSVLEGRSIFI
jgi:hypothetical protein